MSTAVRLVPADRALFDALLGAAALPGGLVRAATPVADPAVLAMLADLADGVAATFAPAAWLVVADGNVAVGLCSLVKPPEGDALTIGYGIAPGEMGKGHATAAVAAVLDWVRGDGRMARVCAETSVNNPASQRVLERNGFARTGTRIDDEDGELVLWEHN